jgi:hypothetical protein
MSDTFSGYDLEAGLLQRVRRWRDALPVLVLLNALRVAGSPLYVGISLIALLFTRAILSRGGSTQSVPVTALTATDQVVMVSPISDFAWAGLPSGLDFLHLLAVLAVWTLPAATLARAGACYAAGRYQTFLQNLSAAGKRLHWLWLIAIVPSAFALALSTVMVGIGVVARAGSIGLWLSEVGALVALPVAILIGLVAAGSIAAIPLGWAAMVVENRCDVFDSLSRGYEYLLRRPVHLLFYSVCSYLLAAICFYLALAVSSAALSITASAVRFGAGDFVSPTAYRIVLQCVPHAVGIAAAWGLVGATYLLMRQSANQQEIEDIAISPIDSRGAELPTLQPTATDASR